MPIVTGIKLAAFAAADNDMGVMLSFDRTGSVGVIVVNLAGGSAGMATVARSIAATACLGAASAWIISGPVVRAEPLPTVIGIKLEVFSTAVSDTGAMSSFGRTGFAGVVIGKFAIVSAGMVTVIGSTDTPERFTGTSMWIISGTSTLLMLTGANADKLEARLVNCDGRAISAGACSETESETGATDDAVVG